MKHIVELSITDENYPGITFYRNGSDLSGVTCHNCVLIRNEVACYPFDMGRAKALVAARIEQERRYLDGKQSPVANAT